MAVLPRRHSGGPVIDVRACSGGVRSLLPSPSRCWSRSRRRSRRGMPLLPRRRARPPVSLPTKRRRSRPSSPTTSATVASSGGPSRHRSIRSTSPAIASCGDASTRAARTVSPRRSRSDSEESFITEHYWGYVRQRDGATLEYQVEHPRWRVWRGIEPELDGDPRRLYGDELSGCLAGRPSSAFVAEGSAVVVRRGRLIA